MSRKELFNEVWRAADIMRRDDGTNGINEYIEQLSWMFFLKVFEDLEKRFENNKILKDEKYSRIISKEHSWSKWTKKESKEIIDYIDTELFQYLGKLSGSPEKNTIGMIFQEVRRNKMKSPSNLKDVIDIINEIDFNDKDDSHVLSLFYEDLLVKLGKESGIAGEFYTPRPIVRLAIKIIDPKLNPKDKENTRMLDPFCGSCGFLVESFKHMMKSKPNSKEYPIIQQMFHGYEKKSLPHLVGLMNCILHELITPKIVRQNSLNDNVMRFGPDDKFDYVLTNPPFGGTENKQIQQNFPVKVTATELLALQQVMRRLKPRGKCAIVVPEGLLSRGDSFAKVRQELVEEYNVTSIISLPAGVFSNVSASGQGPKTDIIFFDRNGTTEKIWFYELVPPKGEKYTKAKIIQDEDLKDCFNKSKKREESNFSWLMEISEIKKKKFDLTPINPNTKKTFEHRKIEVILKDIHKLQKEVSTDLTSVEKLMKS